jgi:hypothetical protein
VFWAEADRRLRALPGVEHVAFASRLPFSLNFNRDTIAIPGHQKSPDETGAPINSASISRDYFQTLGIALLEGRAFAETDQPDRPRVAIVNDTMARKYWPGTSAVGQRVFQRQLSSGRSFEIVGVVADHKLQTVGEAQRVHVHQSATRLKRPGRSVVLMFYDDLGSSSPGEQRPRVGRGQRYAGANHGGGCF